MHNGFIDFPLSSWLKHLCHFCESNSVCVLFTKFDSNDQLIDVSAPPIFALIAPQANDIHAPIVRVPTAPDAHYLMVTRLSNDNATGITGIHHHNPIYFCFEPTANILKASDVRLHPSKNSRSPGRAPKTGSSEESRASRHSNKISDNTPFAHKTGSNKSRAKRPGRKLCKNDPDPLSYDD
ncbi:hypothetical protein BHYA_0147g00030 [Botrytis hyacinthi]|uniref:Uncharacterized protein n=1 Tax=Botrytis hyacinthi TaxID=278943 RepID=A0A4Z1GHT7_9HELO|nr:hypothetical protein BHYA_0147g00030 [Botrytis hyacinthi]